MNQPKTEVLIEPVITRPTWHRKYIPDVAVKGLLGLSLVPNEFKLRVTHKSGPKLDYFLLHYIRIAKGGDVRTFESPGEKRWRADEETLEFGPFTNTFPEAGIYYADCSAAYRSQDHRANQIKTLQRLPEGGEGRGWPDNEPENRWRNPIVVADHAATANLKLNRGIWILTWLLAVLAFLTLAFQGFQAWQRLAVDEVSVTGVGPSKIEAPETPEGKPCNRASPRSPGDSKEEVGEGAQPER